MKLITKLSIAALCSGIMHAQADRPLPITQQTPALHTVTFDSHEDLLHAFHAAAAKASRPILNSFLRSGIWINEPGVANKTALHYAAAESTWGTVCWLLNQGADIEAVDEQNNTPLLAGAHRGRAWNVKDLVDAGANVAHRNVYGRSALDLAINSGDIETVLILIQTECSLDASQEAKGITPLHRAAKKGFVEIAKALIDAGARVNAVAADGMTPLHYAAYSDNPEMITLLIDSKADATLKDNQGRTPRNIAELFMDDHEDCLVCTLSALKIRHWEEAILRLRVAELPLETKEAIETHLRLKKDEL
jgi:ankyrin repeat protein